MGLSEEYKKRIQESLDAETGGRLHAIAAKATAVNAPVLIIGLGGTGMDALRITKKLIYDTIQSEKRTGNIRISPKILNIWALIPMRERKRNPTRACT